MKPRKISVIIPVYNVEKYLERCVYSVLEQSYTNLDIILVDDGSSDHSGVMCDEYEKKDPRVRVIHQHNQGLGEARNTGLKYAVGDYISFVDSDDYLDVCAYEKLCTYMNNYESDICFFGHYRVKGNLITEYDIPPQKLYFSGSKEILEDFFSKSLAGCAKNGDGFTGLSVWCALYKRNVIQRKPIVFQSERKVLSEDILFNMEACANAENISIFPGYLYYYDKRNDSLTRRYREDRFAAALELDRTLKKLAQDYKVSSWVKTGIELCFCMNLIVCLKQEVFFAKQNGYKRVRDNIRFIGLCPETQLLLKTSKTEGLKRKILFKALQWKRWELVHCMVRIWICLENLNEKRCLK